jgi:DNA gyrase subunit B/topoisomerase-4 subunit B
MANIPRDRFGGPAKLLDCVAHAPGSGAELFVVEGDSAAAAVARVRDPRHQAVLCMQGKPLNAARAPRRKVEANPFFGPLAAALGTGLEAACDPGRMRYDRVLVLTDPDADGIHCGFLVLLYFRRWMQPLLDAGRIEVVRPPWGSVDVSGEVRLAFSEAELVALADRGRAAGGMMVRRHRGLAALDAETLAATCVAAATRRTARVSAAEVALMIEAIEALGPAEGPPSDTLATARDRPRKKALRNDFRA